MAVAIMTSLCQQRLVVSWLLPRPSQSQQPAYDSSTATPSMFCLCIISQVDWLHQYTSCAYFCLQQVQGQQGQKLVTTSVQPQHHTYFSIMSSSVVVVSHQPSLLLLLSKSYSSFLSTTTLHPFSLPPAGASIYSHICSTYLIISSSSFCNSFIWISW